MRTPLFLSITLLARQKISITEWEQLSTTDERKTYLLSAYVRQMLVRDIENWYYKAKPIPTAAQTRHWLSWLAQQLQQESKDEFFIEGLQPTNLKNRTQQKIYTWIVWLIVGLISRLLLALTRNRIIPMETFKFSLEPATKIENIFYELILFLIGRLIFGLIYGLRSDFVSRKYPNQGIFVFLQNATWITTLSLIPIFFL